MNIKIFLSCLMLLIASTASAQPTPDPVNRTETFRWTMDVSSAPFTGFKLHYGITACSQPCTGDGTYTIRTDVGLPTPDENGVYSADVQIPQSIAGQTIFVAVTSYNALAQESDYSNERSREAPPGRPNAPTLAP